MGINKDSNFTTIIKRFEHDTDNGNRGNIFLAYNGKTINFGFSMERPNLFNQPNISRINAGIYKAIKVYSKERGFFWLLQNVKDRTEIILFHSGSYVTDFEGCIGCGKKLHDKKNGTRMILETRVNCKKFIELTKNIEEMTVIII